MPILAWISLWGHPPLPHGAALVAALSMQAHTVPSPPALQTSFGLCVTKSMVKIPFVWPGLLFHVFPENRRKCLSSSPHTPPVPWPSSLHGGGHGDGYPQPIPGRIPLPLLLQTGEILTVREIRVLSFLFNRTLWCYSKAHHRMSVWISLWS